MNREKVSVTIITRNEEKNIRHCLNSVAWADEVVLVDSGSTDHTLEICREFGVKVLTNPWPGMNAQKRLAMENAAHPWIFNIDADERVPEELRYHIERALERPEYDGYRVPRKNFFLGKWMRYGGWYPDHVLRLFRKEKGSYGGIDPHDKVIVTDGKVGTLSVPLVHHAYESLSQYVLKQNSYSDASARELVRKGKHISPPAILPKTLWKFIETFLWKRGFLDGVHGLIAALGASCTTFWKYAKAWDLSRRK